MKKLNSVKNTLKEHLRLHFIPNKVKELLAEKRWEGLLFITLLPIYVIFFNFIFRCYVFFLWSISGKRPLFLWQIYSSPSLICINPLKSNTSFVYPQV
jgi:hypothetical protein